MELRRVDQANEGIPNGCIVLDNPFHIHTFRKREFTNQTIHGKQTYFYHFLSIIMNYTYKHQVCWSKQGLVNVPFWGFVSDHLPISVGDEISSIVG